MDGSPTWRSMMHQEHPVKCLMGLVRHEGREKGAGKLRRETCRRAETGSEGDPGSPASQPSSSLGGGTDCPVSDDMCFQRGNWSTPERHAEHPSSCHVKVPARAPMGAQGYRSHTTALGATLTAAVWEKGQIVTLSQRSPASNSALSLVLNGCVSPLAGLWQQRGDLEGRRLCHSVTPSLLKHKGPPKSE